MKRGVFVAVLLVVLIFGFYIISAMPAPTTANYPPTYNTSSYVVFNGTPNNNSAVVNYSLYGNWSGNWAINQTNSTATGIYNSSYVFLSGTPLRMNTFLPEGVYLWAFQVCQSDGCNFSANKTFVIDATAPNVAITVTPKASSVTNQNYISVVVDVNDSGVGLRNTTVLLYNLTNQEYNYVINGAIFNEGFVSSNNSWSTQFTVNFTNLSQGYYFVNATAWDTNNNSRTTSTVNVSSLDTTAPQLRITSPDNRTVWNQSDTKRIYFDLPDKILVSKFWFFNSYNDSNSSTTTTASGSGSSPYTFNFISNFPSGDYVITLYANDTSGNLNSSSLYFTFINSSSSSSNSSSTTSSSSGGNKGGSTTTNFNTSQGGGSGGSVTVNIANSSITQLQITSNTTTTNASVTVTPTNSTPPVRSSSQVYQSFDISLGGLDDTQIINVTINFKINKSWIEDHERDPLNVSLYRNTGTETVPVWNELETSLSREDFQYYYYQTVSPGFSGYAVVVGPSVCDSGEFRCLSDNVQKCGENNIWTTTETCELGCSNGQCRSNSILGGHILYFILVGVIVVLILVVVYLGVKRVKRKNKDKEQKI